MDDRKLPREGGCRCGQVRFKVTAPPLLTMACHCESWMFTRPDGMDWIINVRATLFDDTSGLDPFLETYTSEKLPWATTPAIHSFPEFPELEDYTKLVEEFAALRTSG